MLYTVVLTDQKHKYYNQKDQKHLTDQKSTSYKFYTANVNSQLFGYDNIFIHTDTEMNLKTCVIF